MKIVCYSDDINLLSYWQESLKNRCQIVDTLEQLFKIQESIVIVNYKAFEGDAVGVLKHLTLQDNRVLVLHRVPNIQTAKKMLAYGAMGYGNAMMRDHFIQAAIHTIKDDMIWLYPDMVSELILDIPEQKETKNLDAILQPLTKKEKEVALLLKDGCTYKDIAQKLGVMPRTIKAHASHIYEKLQVKDKISLAILLK